MSARKHGVALGVAVAVGLSTGCVAATAGHSVERAGDALQVVLPGVAAAAALGYGDGEGLGRFAGSAAVTLAVTHGLKHAVDAERPNGGGGSFPSGHASIAFCSAEFLRRRYGWGWGVPAYALATFVAYSRVEAEQHYPRDVVAGAVIGIAASALLTRDLKNTSLSVAARPEGWDAAVTYSW